MRQLISDTATAMFLERGFDEVKVAEVATACDVSEKTVYNYFPAKEALLLDREEESTAAIWRALGPDSPAASPVDAAVGVIAGGLGDIEHNHSPVPGMPALVAIRRFTELIEETPALLAYQRAMMDRLVDVAAQAMAARAGVDPDDPEPQIAAHAILGLWRVEFLAMRRHSEDARTPAELRAMVLDEVRRAARLVDTGLWAFGLAVQGADRRDQIKAAADAANAARKQVMAALDQARDAWRLLAESHHGDDWGSRRWGGRGRIDPRAAAARAAAREAAIAARDAARQASRAKRDEHARRGRDEY